MLKGDLALVRTAEVFAIVQTVAQVRAVKEYDGGVVFGRRWAALLTDASASVPAFGFETPPPIGAWIAVQGTVGGFPAQALQDPGFVAQMTSERGWVDEIELGVDGWTTIEAL
jgi:hypothetical protein